MTGAVDERRRARAAGVGRLERKRVQWRVLGLNGPTPIGKVKAKPGAVAVLDTSPKVQIALAPSAAQLAARIMIVGGRAVASMGDCSDEAAKHVVKPFRALADAVLDGERALLADGQARDIAAAACEALGEAEARLAAQIDDRDVVIAGVEIVYGRWSAS